MTSPQHTPPIIFYQSTRTYRNARTFLVMLVVALVSANFVNAVVQKTFYHNHNGPPAFILWGGAAIFLALLFVCLRKMILNASEVLQVSSRGIDYRNQFWPWEKILAIKPSPVSFSKKAYLSVQLSPPRKGLTVTFPLRGQHPLTPEEYAQLTSRLADFFHQNQLPVQIQPS